jgi:hypothetical protein
MKELGQIHGVCRWLLNILIVALRQTLIADNAMNVFLSQRPKVILIYFVFPNQQPREAVKVCGLIQIVLVHQLIPVLVQQQIIVDFFPGQEGQEFLPQHGLMIPKHPLERSLLKKWVT